MGKARNLLIILSIISIAGIDQARAGQANPYLRLVQKSEGLQRLHQAMRITPLGLLRDTASPVLVPALLRSADPEVTAEACRQMGGHAGRAVGSVLPVRATPDVLASLAARDEVSQLQAIPPRRTKLDLSRPQVGADRTEAGEGLLMPIDGTGVIAALVDTGIDFQHDDFLNAAGKRTRVQALWDQAFASGEPPPGQDVGAYCDRDSLVRADCTSIDLVGHGTHVAATMAGSGEVYRGMAPGADLMAVGSLDFGLLLESVDWLFEQAAAKGQPMVINLSLGGHYGPHDGTSLESQALSDLTGPGRIIMASAGNEGADYIHLGYDPQGGTGKTVFQVFSGMDISAALFTIWLQPGADLAFAIGVQTQAGEVAESDFVDATDSYRVFNLSDGATSLGRVQIEPAGLVNPENGKLQVDILVEPSQAAFQGNPAGYTWTFKTQGTGEFDAWSAVSGFLTPAARFSNSTEGGLMPGDNHKVVGMPAVALGVIAVASWATRKGWTDIDGNSINHLETTVDDISFFSSRGPSAEPEHTGQKPFITAPGEYIVAALSMSSGALEQGTRIDTSHVAMRGTSMSCPHAAGIVALLLQVDPTLDPDGVRTILAATARADDLTTEVLPNDDWGHGKIDAYEAVAMAMGVGICTQDTDCTDGYHCADSTRCEEKSAAGCGCASTPTSGQLLLLLFGLALLALRRKRG